VTDDQDGESGQGPQAKTPPELEVVEVKESVSPKTRPTRTHPSAKKGKHRSPAAVTELPVEDDPWVTDSIKVRHSKKRRLKDLSLRRELGRESPYQKKDLVDEAFDFIFAKYEKR